MGVFIACSNMFHQSSLIPCSFGHRMSKTSLLLRTEDGCCSAGWVCLLFWVIFGSEFDGVEMLYRSYLLLSTE